MAKIYGEIVSSALMTFDKSFARSNGQPLDSTEVFYSLAAAQEYATTDVAYVGQKIVVIATVDDVTTVTHYGIEADNSLKELGAVPVADGDTIEVVDGKIQIASIEGHTTGTYQPFLVDGKIEWREPSSITVEGLDTKVQDIEKAVGVPATDDAEASGLYLAIAEGIQEAKDYADANDADTTYTLDYTDASKETAVSGGLMSDGTYLVTLTGLSVPDGVKELVISNDVTAEIVAFTSSSVQFITATEPSNTTIYNVSGMSNGLPTGYAVSHPYIQYGSHSNVYNVIGVSIPDNAESVETSQGAVIWNLGESAVKIAGNFTNGATANITYTTSYKAINLVDNDNNVISSIDATPFIKDGMLHDVAYDASNNTLTFTWNTDAGEKSDTVVLSDIIEPYTAGHGVDITDNEISVMVDPASEGYISVGETGVKVAGIDQAIADAVADETDRATTAEGALSDRIDILEAIDHTQYATNSALSEVKTTANNAAAKVETLEDKIEEITSVGGEPNTIDYVQINGNTLSVSDKTVNIGIKRNGEALEVNSGVVDIAVPTKVSDLTDDNDWAGQIAQAQSAANDAATAATGAQTTADNALAQAQANAADIVLLQNVDSAHQEEYNALADIVNGHTTAIAGKADTTALAATDLKVASLENSIVILNETTIPAINAEIEKKANSEDVYTKDEIDTIVEEAQEASTYDDTQVTADIKANADAIAAIYKVDGENVSGVLVDEVARIEELVAAEKERAEIVEDDHEERIAKMELFWEAADDPEGTIDKLAEIVKYIESDKSGALTMAENIQQNTESIAENAEDIFNLTAVVNGHTDAIAEINNAESGILATAKKYTDDSIAAIPVATAETLGLVKVDDTTIKAEDGTISVKAISTDLLVQGVNELILNGGSAVSSK